MGVGRPARGTGPVTPWPRGVSGGRGTRHGGRFPRHRSVRQLRRDPWNRHNGVCELYFQKSLYKSATHPAPGRTQETFPEPSGPARPPPVPSVPPAQRQGWCHPLPVGGQVGPPCAPAFCSAPEVPAYLPVSTAAPFPFPSCECTASYFFISLGARHTGRLQAHPTVRCWGRWAPGS